MKQRNDFALDVSRNVAYFKNSPFQFIEGAGHILKVSTNSFIVMTQPLSTGPILIAVDAVAIAGSPVGVGVYLNGYPL